MHLFTLYAGWGGRKATSARRAASGARSSRCRWFPSMEDADVQRVVEAVDDTLHRLV